MANKKRIQGFFFFVVMVLGLSGLGQTWRIATQLWPLPHLIGESLLLLAGLVWAVLCWVISGRPFATLIWCVEFCIRYKAALPPCSACINTADCISRSTTLFPKHSLAVDCGQDRGWYLMFALWRTGTLWQGGRDTLDTAPTLYLPTVAGNFTSAAAQAPIDHADWGWLFLGAGVFSWLALESLIIQRLWHPKTMPVCTAIHCSAFSLPHP